MWQGNAGVVTCITLESWGLGGEMVVQNRRRWPLPLNSLDATYTPARPTCHGGNTIVVSREIEGPCPPQPIPRQSQPAPSPPHLPVHPQPMLHLGVEIRMRLDPIAYSHNHHTSALCQITIHNTPPPLPMRNSGAENRTTYPYKHPPNYTHNPSPSKYPHAPYSRPPPTTTQASPHPHSQPSAIPSP